MLKAIIKEGNTISCTVLQMALDASDTAARSTATSMVMGCSSWLQAVGVSKDLQAKVQELPFDKAKLFAAGTDEALHSSKDSCTTSRKCYTPNKDAGTQPSLDNTNTNHLNKTSSDPKTNNREPQTTALQ